jgi:hypothetical protein
MKRKDVRVAELLLKNRIQDFSGSDYRRKQDTSCSKPCKEPSTDSRLLTEMFA